MKYAGAIFSLIMLVASLAGATAFLVHGYWMATLAMSVMTAVFGWSVYRDWVSTWKPLLNGKH